MEENWIDEKCYSIYGFGWQGGYTDQDGLGSEDQEVFFLGGW